jgi:hypothetical protein
MGNKQRKIKRKAAAAKLRKTGGVPPVTLAVTDPILAFTQSIPVASTPQVSFNRAMRRLFKDVRLNRPQKGPLKKVKLSAKRTLMERLALRKDGDRLILDVIPGDPIATLDGRPFRRHTEENGEDGVEAQENGIGMAM